MTSAVEKVRRTIARRPSLEAELRTRWDHVVTVLEIRCSGRGLKVFEVHHMLETAREAFLCAVAADALHDHAMIAACLRLSLPPVLPPHGVRKTCSCPWCL